MAAGEEESGPGQEQQDGTGAHFVPLSCPIQTLRLRPSGQRGHLRPQHGALHLQGEGGGALVQQVSTTAPGWGWNRGPFPGWGLCWGSVVGAGQVSSLPWGIGAFPAPTRDPSQGLCDGNPAGLLPAECSCIPLDHWDWAHSEPSVPTWDAAVVPCGSACPVPPAPVSSPCPGASRAGLTCNPTTPPVAPAASATATPPPARRLMATR